MELLKRAHEAGTTQQIAAAIRRSPGIVAEVWDIRWDCRWDGANWVPTQDDGGRQKVPWVWAFRVAGFTLNSKPAPLPDQPIVLYRGATHVRRLGMSWTPDYATAATYAGRCYGKGPRQCGNVYQAWAYPSEVLARIVKPEEQHDEYILDPTHLADRLNPVAVNVANYPDEAARCMMNGRPVEFAILEPYG